jgi:hypothetical protein
MDFMMTCQNEQHTHRGSNISALAPPSLFSPALKVFVQLEGEKKMYFCLETRETDIWN